MPSSPSQSPDEQPGLLRILASVFSGVLFGLFLSKLRAPISQSADAPHGQDSTNNRTEYPRNHAVRGVRVTETNGPPTPPQCNYPDKKPKHWWKRWKPYVFLFNVATFVVVAWYACITN